MSKLSLRMAVAMLAIATAAPQALGQDGPITFLVGYSAGGSADFAARTLAPELSERLGRTVVVENATGASGMIALQNLINARADGNTIYYGGIDTVSVPMVNSAITIDWEAETVPVGRTAITSMALAVPAASPYNTLEDLVAAAKADPESITFGTPGIASSQHFVGEMISSAAGISLIHAPYQGGSQVATDLLGGMLDSAVFTTSTVLPFVTDGSARALAVSTEDRSPVLPDVPTLNEIPGFEGLALPIWQGIFVKAGTDDTFVQTLRDALTETLAEPEVQEKLATAGFTASPLDGPEFIDFIKAQQATYTKIIDQAGISIE